MLITATIRKTLVNYSFEVFTDIPRSSQWPRCLRSGCCGCSLTGIPGSNPPGSVEVCLLWVFCLSGSSLCDGLITSTESPAECGVSDCDREASTKR